MEANGEGIYGSTYWTQYKEGDTVISSGSFNDSDEVDEVDKAFTCTVDGDSKVYSFFGIKSNSAACSPVYELSKIGGGSDYLQRRANKLM